MARRPKMKVTKGKAPKKMARGGTLKADPKKGVIYEGLEQPLEKGHGNTTRMVSGIRSAKNKMPAKIKNLFPDI